MFSERVEKAWISEDLHPNEQPRLSVAAASDAIPSQLPVSGGRRCRIEDPSTVCAS